MPRGKRIVFAGYCKECNARIDTERLHKNKEGKTWKDAVKDRKKYCKDCKKRVDVVYKEERHSN